jgi:hypothetical protein
MYVCVYIYIYIYIINKSFTNNYRKFSKYVLFFPSLLPLVNACRHFVLLCFSCVSSLGLACLLLLVEFVDDRLCELVLC